MPSACIVVGGSGFVGSALVPMLAAKGLDIVVISHLLPPQPFPSARYLQADIRDHGALMRLRGKCPKDAWVVNLAARQYLDKIPKVDQQNWFSSVNVAGALNVGRLAEKLGAPGLVFFSTDMVYGIPNAAPIKEDHVLRPIGAYGKSKVQMEQQVGAFAQKHGLPLTILRPRLIVGKGRLGVLAKLFALIRKNLPVPLIGKGRNHYPMVSVDDCAAAVLAAIDRGCPRATYNLGSKPTLSVHELMRALINAVHSRSVIVPMPAPIVRSGIRVASLLGIELLYPEQHLLANKDLIVATDKASAELGWRPQADDLDMMVNAYNFWNSLN